MTVLPEKAPKPPSYLGVERFIQIKFHFPIQDRPNKTSGEFSAILGHYDIISLESGNKYIHGKLLRNIKGESKTSLN